MSLERGMLILLLIWTLVVFGIGYSLGKDAGYDRALADVKLITPPKTTDQQCVAWLFEANMKDVKRKMSR
jgi:hypothetical protein